MQIAVVIEGQMNLSYEQQLAAARRAEAVGISGLRGLPPGSQPPLTSTCWAVPSTRVATSCGRPRGASRQLMSVAGWWLVPAGSSESLLSRSE